MHISLEIMSQMHLRYREGNFVIILRKQTGVNFTSMLQAAFLPIFFGQNIIPTQMSGVNFTNILQATFFIRKCFYVLKVWVNIFWREEINAKTGRK